MNPYKYNWYLQTQDIDLGLRVGKAVPKEFTLMRRGKPRTYTTDDSVYTIAKEQYWDNYTYNPKNLKDTYNTPLGQLFVDGILMVYMPALAIGKRAKRVIEVTRHLAEYLE